MIKQNLYSTPLFEGHLWTRLIGVICEDDNRGREIYMETIVIFEKGTLQQCCDKWGTAIIVWRLNKGALYFDWPIKWCDNIWSEFLVNNYRLVWNMFRILSNMWCSYCWKCYKTHTDHVKRMSIRYLCFLPPKGLGILKCRHF